MLAGDVGARISYYEWTLRQARDLHTRFLALTWPEEYRCIDMPGTSASRSATELVIAAARCKLSVDNLRSVLVEAACRYDLLMKIASIDNPEDSDECEEDLTDGTFDQHASIALATPEARLNRAAIYRLSSLYRQIKIEDQEKYMRLVDHNDRERTEALRDLNRYRDEKHRIDLWIKSLRDRSPAPAS